MIPALLTPLLLALSFADGGTDAGAGPDGELWLYCATNLLVDENATKLERLFARAGKAGYSKVLLSDTKLARLGTMDARYFKNAERVKQAARANRLEIVPAICPIGYSEALLFHDPNLAEALPVKDAPFLVARGEARLVPDRRPLTTPTWKDENMVPGDGAAADAARWTVRDAGGANARVVFKVRVTPWRQYHVAVKVATKEFEGEPRVQALVGNDGLIFSNLGVQRTQELTLHHAIFNSLEHDEVGLYFGAWGAGKGELTFAEPALEEVGLLNVVRREGAPLEIAREDGTKLVEGRDFEPLSDPRMGDVPWPGSFELWHEPPTIHTRLPDGTKLRVSYQHAITVHDGQVMICPSEKRTLEMIRDEAKRVHELFGGHAFFLSHDEIRVLNQDESCRRRRLDAGALLADHVRSCLRIAREVDPRAKLYVWSDMFDPHHNAHANYYLVRGDLAGSWEGLDKDVVVADWNFEKRDESLKFFADRGHEFLLAGYYDGPVEQVRDWLASARKVRGLVGVMYTTWQDRYDDLERFAEVARGAR